MILDSDGMKSLDLMNLTRFQTPLLRLSEEAVEMRPIWIDTVMMPRLHHARYSDDILVDFALADLA